jgi:hypothetical protein
MLMLPNQRYILVSGNSHVASLCPKKFILLITFQIAKYQDLTIGGTTVIPTYLYKMVIILKNR